jgi:hypothetical protein
MSHMADNTAAERMRRMRQRRREGLNPSPDAPLRSADELVSPAVREALAALDLGPEHAAAARLAERYAAVLDTAKSPEWAARWVGPLLLDCLAELGGTPAARAKIRPAKSGKEPPSWLDQMRAARPRPPGGVA